MDGVPALWLDLQPCWLYPHLGSVQQGTGDQQVSALQNMDGATIASIATAASSVLVATIGYFGRKVHKGLQTANEVRDQVSNGHETNLRDDIDKILEGQSKLLSGQAEHTAQIAILQEDLAWERRERMDLARVVHGRTPLA
jgi:uncharacterized membrane-anchored protein